MERMHARVHISQPQSNPCMMCQEHTERTGLPVGSPVRVSRALRTEPAYSRRRYSILLDVASACHDVLLVDEGRRELRAVEPDH